MSGSKLPRAVQRLVRLSVRPTSRPILEACPKLLQAADSGRGFSWLPNLQVRDFCLFRQTSAGRYIEMHESVQKGISKPLLKVRLTNV